MAGAARRVRTVILGNGGHARVLRSMLAGVAVMVEDNGAVGPDDSLILGMGDLATRRKAVARFGAARFVSVVAEGVWLPNEAKIGRGVQIMRGAIVQPGCRIGDFVVLNTGAQIDHDCTLEDFVFLGPGAVLAGGAVAKNGAFIGANATVLPQVTVGRDAIVGAGAVVTRNVPHRATVVGNPARELRVIDAE